METLKNHQLILPEKVKAEHKREYQENCLSVLTLNYKQAGNLRRKKGQEACQNYKKN